MPLECAPLRVANKSECKRRAAGPRRILLYQEGLEYGMSVCLEFAFSLQVFLPDKF